MIIARTVEELREALRPRRSGRIGFVPTMGALHEGHLTLLRAAAGENDTTVLSIFVNPTQFDRADDLAAYPRTVERDLTLAAGEGVDVVFLPDRAEMYPEGFSTTVSVTGPLTSLLEGAARGSAHFDGVATVVAKLLLAVLPDAAYFGEKDAQQLIVVVRMVTDLGIPVRIVAVPTSRDPDGLARSSRNVHLTAHERVRALAIPRGLRAAESAVRDGERDAATVRALASAQLQDAGIEPEYLALVDPATLADVAIIDQPTLIAVAARVGTTRLIDNLLLTPGASPGAGAAKGNHE